ncbi:MAG TPA: hypothetical protein VMV81_07105 [Phycisphaerae bacterium]|nr:hypothetical protein [Phycisphaerae bacterium]
MATEAQIAANRRNSQKSTGPRTEAGKSVSRMNALKSGLHARSVLIRDEEPAEFDALTAEYHAEFQPVTPRQRDLVDTLVYNQWVIRRLRATEAELYDYHFVERDYAFEPKYDFHIRRGEHPLADAFNNLDASLARLQSRINALERSSRNALKELHELRRQSGAGDSACQLAEGRPAGPQPVDPEEEELNETNPIPPETTPVFTRPRAPQSLIPNPQSPAGPFDNNSTDPII